MGCSSVRWGFTPISSKKNLAGWFLKMNLGVALPYIKCLNEETVQIGTVQAPQAIKTEGIPIPNMLSVRI